MVQVTCHPDRKHYAFGFCQMCYKRNRRPLVVDTLKKQSKRLYQRNIEKARAYNRKYYAEHIKQERNKRLKSRYGITLDQYNKMYAEQNGLCSICLDEVKTLYVDHNHFTGKVRGLLCMNCNCMVGQYERKPDIAENLEAYLAGSFCGL